MKRVLVYGNRKSDSVIWDASTPKLEEKAFKALFKVLETWEVYGELIDPEPRRSRCKHTCEHHDSMPDSTNSEKKEDHHRQLYKKAKQGDFQALKLLLRERQDYEYECWNFVELSD